MVSKAATPSLDLLLDPAKPVPDAWVGQTTARVAADERLQSIVDDLGEKANQGTLTPDEKAKYETFVSFGSFVALLKSKARLMLSNAPFTY